MEHLSSYLRFSPDEYRLLAGLWQQLDLGGRPRTDFKYLLVEGLAGLSPNLAEAIGRLHGLELGILSDHFREQTESADEHAFTPAELRVVMEACASFPFGRRLVRRFKVALVELFQEACPELSRKVARLSGHQFKRLYEQACRPNRGNGRASLKREPGRGFMANSVNRRPPRSEGPREKHEVGAPLRIALADRDGKALDRLRQMLSGYGHEVVVACQDGAVLVRGCREHQPDLVVIEMEMAVPGPASSLADLVLQICEGREIPIIAVSTSCTNEDMEEVRSHSCVAHLIKPISEQSLVATISLSIHHFEVLAAVCRELTDLRNTVEARKIVDRAKGILMNRAGMSETQAHARLQELASSRNMKMATVADLIVEAELAFSKMIS